MAEGLLRASMLARSDSAVVESAGIGALVGWPADPIAVELMSERGIDISRHRARQLDEELLFSFPLVLAMESSQKKFIERTWPLARGRVHSLGRWGDFEVPDPFRCQRIEFERSLALIDRGVEDWLCRL